MTYLETSRLSVKGLLRTELIPFAHQAGFLMPQELVLKFHGENHT